MYLFLKHLVSQSLKNGQKWQFLYFKPILLINFATIATVKVFAIVKFENSLPQTLCDNSQNEFDPSQYKAIGGRGRAWLI